MKVLKENRDILSNFLSNSFNNSIKLSAFPEILKHADITSLYKKGKKDIKGNYRPVSILPNLSKIFEKCMFEEKHWIYSYFIFLIKKKIFDPKKISAQKKISSQ